ncbi:MAG: DUF2088 domain-containing protein [Armatimonadetes bacterium]|nr:DUF2088 domain-containing protein [Candidatus Hippobium faecium]
MTYSFSNSAKSIEIPDASLDGIYDFVPQKEKKDFAFLLKRATENPIGTEKLEHIAKYKNNALIVTEMIREKSFVKETVSFLCKKLEQTGISNIKILTPLYRHSIDKTYSLFGEEIFKKYLIITHDYSDSLDLCDIGYSSFGTRLYVNKAVTENDLIIGIREVAPNQTVGFSGGSEVIFPGISSHENIEKIKWDSALYKNIIFGTTTNPIRKEMDECAEKVGLDFIINWVTDPSGNIYDVTAGDFRKAYAHAVRSSKKVRGAQFVCKSDITILDCGKKDRNILQMSKALEAAEYITKTKGVIILVSSSSAIIPPEYDYLKEKGYRSEKETLKDFEKGNIPSLNIAAHLLKIGRIISEKYTCFLADPYILPQTVSKLGLYHTHDCTDAVRKALFLTNRNARFTVLRNACDTLPVNILKQN